MGNKKLSRRFSFEELKDFHWRGNVRELRNYLEKKLIYSSLGEQIQPVVTDNLPEEGEQKQIMLLEDHVRDYVLKVLKTFKYNKTKTADALGLSLSTLKRKLKKWDVEVKKTLTTGLDPYSRNK